MDTSDLKYYDKRDIYSTFNNKKENKYYDKRKQSPPPDHIKFLMYILLQLTHLGFRSYI